MKQASAKPQRCAVYTRKSTEHNLDLAFNSLDAQREACEAYIKSQAHEGWRLIPAYFDDGGLSGASLQRPALQALINEVKAKKIDIIVVYKVDRLTRSLADFAKLVELFDEYGVSFVSVTQSFNTTSSMGRLTLNVLLSFAQFEREVIGERVRDKIAASKRKGLWVGGPVPLGYQSKDKKLEIVPAEAELVRKIFADYLKLGSIGRLVASLNTEGIKPKPRRLADGTQIAAKAFRVGPIAHLLKNRFYIGEIVYCGEIHRGEHEPILDRTPFEAVQHQLADQAVQRNLRRSASPFSLTGLIYDDHGNRMTPSHANKKGIRYRYYVSQAVLQNQKDKGGSISRVSAPDVESLVLDAVVQWLKAEQHFEKPEKDDSECADTGKKGNADFSNEDLHTFIERVTIYKTFIEICVKTGDREEEASNEDKNAKDGNLRQRLTVPFAPHHPLRKGFLSDEGAALSIDAKTRENLLKAIARACRWTDALLDGNKQSFEEIAAKERLAERYVRRLAQLAFLSPKIIEAIKAGTAPADLTISRLTQSLPYAWADQERAIGLA